MFFDNMTKQGYKPRMLMGHYPKEFGVRYASVFIRSFGRLCLSSDGRDQFDKRKHDQPKVIIKKAYNNNRQNQVSHRPYP
jgi:hypothetical protein